MSDGHYSRLTPRFSIDEEPGDGPLSARQPWVGAFERVLGDQDCHSEPRQQKSRSRGGFGASPLGVQPAVGSASQRTSISEDTIETASSSASTGSHASGSSSPAFPGSSSALDQYTLRPPPMSDAQSQPAHVLSVTGKSQSPSHVGEASLTMSRATSPASLVGSSDSNLKRLQDSAPKTARSNLDSLSLNCKNAGPHHIAISPDDSIVFDNAYTNHAPCIHRLTVRNQNSEQSVLVRLETTLKQGVTFMRRKRSAPKHDFEPCAWPSNGLAWARAGGLSPPNLRGWRHVVANLENADSFILDPNQSTSLYVMLRPSAFTEEGESDLLQPWSSYKPPPSPVFIDPVGVDKSAPSTSPLSTPAAIGDQREPFSGLSTSSDDGARTDPMVGSPRSAPELDGNRSATRDRDSTARPRFTWFNVRGSVVARAWALPRVDTALSTDDEISTLQNSSQSSASSSRPTSYYGSTKASTANSSLHSMPEAFQDEQMQTKVLSLSATCCRPYMDAAVPGETMLANANVGLINLDFGDVIVGQCRTQSLVLRNLAEIECFGHAKLEEADNLLQSRPITLDDADEDVALPVIQAGDDSTTYNPFVLAPRRSKRINISLRPQEPCRDYEQVLTFTNLHDSSNSIRVVIRANMLGTAKDDSLMVLSGDVLDFGDCYGGHWTRQLLILRNNADVLLDVEFGVQKGVEVNFQLAELAPQTEEDSQAEDELPPASVASITSEISRSSAGDDSSRFSSAADSGRIASETAASHAALELGATASELEMARTPTHRAHIAHDGPEPPRLELSALEALSSQLEQGNDRGREDVDASSVASQAGSRSNSPSRQPPSASSGVQSASHRAPKESLSSRLERVDTGPMATSRVGMARAASDADRVSVSTHVNSQASSGFLSRPSSRGRGLRSVDASERGAEDAGSSKSEVTALSQDSRLGPFAATSSHAGSVTSSKHHRSTPGAVLSGLQAAEQAHSNQLEELVLRPGGEYRVVVSYRPQREKIDDEFTGGRLVDRTFRISLDYSRSRSGNTRTKGGRERRTVLCQSRTCTSFISISPKVIDLGEVQVGTRKSAHVSVTNRSELTARVDLRFVSKVLTMYRDEVAIPALQTVELKVDSFPRRVNESYRKQITVANLLNRHNDQIFEVRSTNVDKQRISFHSLFYRILTPTGSNFIDFGDVNINSSRIRTFSIENTSGAKLALELTAAHPEDVTLYVKAPSEKKKAPGAARDGASVADGAAVASRISKKYADLEDAEVSVPAEGESKAKSSKPSIKGSDLKERFLETISVDSPASIRRENASWRLAQKHSHFSRKESSSVSAQKREAGPAKPKPHINLVSALKRGGKGRLTQQYGRAVTFKDRKLLTEFEYLDLAVGPPVDARRISAKSKRYQMLESIATGGKTKASSSSSSSAPASSGAAGKVKATNTLVEDSSAKAGPDVKSTKRQKPSVSGAMKEAESRSVDDATRRLPSPLAKEIQHTTKSLLKTPAKSIATERERRRGANATSGSSGQVDSKADKESGKVDSGARVHFSPALTAKRKASPVLSNPVDVSRMSLEDLLAAVENQASTLSTLFMRNAEAEEQFVRAEINLQRELESAIDSRRLLPIEVLSLEPGADKQVIAVYHPTGSTRPHIQGNARKQDSRIFMRLIEFDMGVVKQSDEFAEMADLDADELPVRDLMMRSNTCRSLLELGQPHINFGHMEKGDSKTRRILIQNRSEWALRYCIRKSGSIASGDIKFSIGRYGVVPGYGKREVEFVFSPSMSGLFQEKLVVENVADRDTDQMVVLKSNVRKVPNFAVDPVAIDFGACAPGKLSTPESFVLTNTTSKSRTFVIAVDPADLLLERCILDVGVSVAGDGEVRGTLSKEEEEEIENISQKLKIANRKGNLDKVKKYEDRLVELGVKPAPAPVATTDAELNGDSVVVDDQSAAASNKAVEGSSTVQPPQQQQQQQLKRISSTVTCSLGPNQSKRLVLRVRASAVQSAIRSGDVDPSDRRDAGKAGVEEVELAVNVHEVKNKDETKVVMVRASVEFELDQAAGSGTDSIAKVAEAMPADAVVFTALAD